MMNIKKQTIFGLATLVGLFSIIFLISNSLKPASQSLLKSSLVSPPLYFESNHGQIDSRVKFISRGKGYGMFLTPEEIVLSLSKEKEDAPVLRMKLVGANPSPYLMGMGELPGRSHYFRGNDPTKWRTDVSHYEKVKYSEVYPGIDLVFYGNGRELEYDLIVQPGSDPRQIEFNIQGTKKIEVDEGGNLVLQLDKGKVIQRAPKIYQKEGEEQEKVEGRFILKGNNNIGFLVAQYDTRKELVIDPIKNEPENPGF